MFLWGHAIGLTIFGLARGWHPAYAIGEGAVIALIAALASYPRFGRKFRSSLGALGAVTSSAVLTQFGGGFIEAHFHYFVVVALIATYQDWMPFLLAVGFVAINHGLIGSIMPSWVYNHPSAMANPWGWGLLHAGFVLAECVVLIAWWKTNERDRAQTDLVLRSAGEGILGVGQDGRIVFANPGAARLLGRAHDNLVGLPLGQALQGAAYAGATDPILQVHAAPLQGATASAGTLWLNGNGRKTPIDWSMNPILESGTNKGFVVTLMDASQRQRAEEERERRMRQVSDLERLQAQDQFKTLFINTAAHELHTPLTPLRLNLFALKEGHRGVLNEEQLDTINVLDRNVERLSHLVEDVLDAARIQANRLAVDKQALDLSVLVHEAVDSFHEQARAGGVVLETRLKPNLMVLGDRRRLDQVLMNLLTNAMKFTPTGGRITVSTGLSRDQAYFRVEDTGIGLGQEDLAKLFQPFSQGHNPMEQTRVGSGLGLYICRSIMNLHEGTIEAHSEGVGRGSSFTCRLQVAPVPKPELSAGQISSS